MDRQAWLKARQQGLGGSDIAAVAGVHQYESAWSTYWSKVLPVTDEPASEAAQWGQLLEGAVAEEWGHRTGYRLQDSDWLHVHPQHDWWIGTPDRLIVNNAGELTAGLEVKLVSEDAWRYSWDSGAMIPVHYQVQCQWYLGLLGLREWHLAALVGGRRLEQFTIQRDDRALARLEEIGRAFWFDHVLPQIPPTPDGSERTRDLLDAIYPVPPDSEPPAYLPLEAVALVSAYNLNARAEKDAAQGKAEAANQLIAMLGAAGATDGYLPGQDTDDEAPAVTYRPTRVVDIEALIASVPADVKADIEPCWRRTVGIEALEKAVGKKLVDQYRKPGDTRRLHVRAREETP